MQNRPQTITKARFRRFCRLVGKGMNFFGILKRFSLKYLAAAFVVVLFTEMVFGFAPHTAIQRPAETDVAVADSGSTDNDRRAQRLSRRERRRMKQAEGGIAELRNKVDSLVIIPNERLKLASDTKITMQNAFEIADDVLQQAVQSISDLIKNTGFINLDFADVSAVMKDAGRAHMGVGRAAGKDKAEAAAKMAISSPLLETSIEGAKGVLINVTGSMDIGLEEVEQAASLVQQAVHPDALTIFGATFDETMDDEIRVTVIATGFDKNPADELPKIGTFAKPPVQLEGQEKDEQPKAPFAPIEPIAPAEEKPAEPEEDPFDDIFKIFNRRD